MKYLKMFLVGFSVLGFLSCGEEAAGGSNGEVWEADLGEKGGASIIYRLDFSSEPQLFEGLYIDGHLAEGILGTYEFNEEGLTINTDKCVQEMGQELSKANCLELGEVEQKPIFKTETGYVLVRSSRIYEVTEGGEGIEYTENDTIPFHKR